MELPNKHQADLGNKIENYCLNPNHQKGKNKATLFQNKLGINLTNADILKKEIKQAAINESVIIRKVNEYGTHYNMKLLLKTDVGESLILVAWIIRKGEDFPRLTNCYPVNK
ncbi:MAG: hypothetical protein F6K54_14290 [Okeania sp. SIO3B5]|uniref:DUF6883 domain-containing protein n=1 Tax=Okeania sp. SIO3B5 TaxID=2607811 RepID=UPI0013FFADB2|nr:DUF6883 domain-containing protein [Okeania sp. SIO3B5]NEO54144.1 hypothetical protein [Okeania sp. SIO3B5]